MIEDIKEEMESILINKGNYNEREVEEILKLHYERILQILDKYKFKNDSLNKVDNIESYINELEKRNKEYLEELEKYKNAWEELITKVKRAVKFENDDIEYLDMLFNDATNGMRCWLDKREIKRGKELILQLYKAYLSTMQELERKYNIRKEDL